MKTFVLLPLLVAAFGDADVRANTELDLSPRVEAKNCACIGQADPGYCAQRLTRYYFDTVHKICKPFFYGGCPGNSNNYLSAAECMASCAPTTDYERDCIVPPDTTPCFGSDFQAWAYYSTEGVCKEYTSGGCSNRNSYKTKEACEAKCVRSEGNNQTASLLVVGSSLPPLTSSRSSSEVVHNFACLQEADPGTCNAYIDRYNFDNVTGTCKKFVYGGCGGNWNNYETREECMASCAPATDYEGKCLARAEVGPCRAGIPMWAYYSKDGQCKKFLYGGCDGNDNKYRTKEDCESTCLKTEDTTALGSRGVTEACSYPFIRMTSSSVCSLEKDPGPCNMFVPHFYYNPASASCEVFTYGGCKGNGNNFMSLTECLVTCSTEYAVLPRA